MRPLFPSIIGLFICILSAGNLFAQQGEPKVFDLYEDFESHVREYASSTVVINFWATYCAPCVKELSYFDSLQQKYASHNVKVILVNLDFKTHLKERVIPFLNKHQLSAEVVVLADQDADSWVSKVSSDWDGGLPFTLVLKQGKKYTHTSEFQSYNDLEKFVSPYIERKQTLAAKRR